MAHNKGDRMKIFLTKRVAENILDRLNKIKDKQIGSEKIEISPDLGLSKMIININDFDDNKLKKIMKTNAVYYYDTETKEYYKIAIYNNRLYCQLNVFDKYPVLTINGFRMHRVLDDPLKYVNQIIKLLRIKQGNSILDTCMGLGYSAIEAAKQSNDITTCEKNDCVYEIAKVNPWSSGLFSNKNIKIIRQDVIDYISKTDRTFDIIIHDPPTIKMTPELYSREFYGMINKISNEGAKMFHYFGDINKEQNMRAYERAVKEMGWKVRFYPEVLGAIFVNE